MSWKVLVLTVLHSISLVCESKTLKDESLAIGINNGFISKENAQNPVVNVEFSKSELGDIQSIILDESNGVNDCVSDSSHKAECSHSLVFHQSRYIGTINENEPVGTTVSVIGQLSAACNGTASYSLQSGLEDFHLKTLLYNSEHNNVLTAQHSFDREEKDFYVVVIEAHCSDGQKAQTSVEVHILDINDNIPAFNETSISVRTTTGQLWGEIVTLTAFDADMNDPIKYMLEKSEDFFVDPDTGDLFAEKDYLFPGRYSVVAFALDTVGHRSLPVTVNIKVISDVLKFKSLHDAKVHRLSKRATTTIARSFDIVENSTTTAHLFSVASVQPRPPAERYVLVSSSVDMFLPPNSDGSVYLKPGMKLDYEDEKQREILVIFNRTNLNTPEGRFELSILGSLFST